MIFSGSGVNKAIGAASRLMPNTATRWSQYGRASSKSRRYSVRSLRRLMTPLLNPVRPQGPPSSSLPVPRDLSEFVQHRDLVGHNRDTVSVEMHRALAG